MKFLRILLVEDYDAVSLGVRETLMQSTLACEVMICTSSDQALKTLYETPIDILLLDLILKPNRQDILEDGDELLREIKRRKLGVKTIIVSKIDTLSVLDYVINNLNAEGYILKSRTSLNELIPAIRTVLSGRRFLSDSIERLMKAYDQTLDIDYIDRVILSSLARGYKQKELEEVLFSKRITITLSAIEKRIKKLKYRFGTETLIEMVALAIKEGIIYL